jgi:hypothetical protein
MHNYATKSGCNVLDQLLRECTCKGSTMLWTSILFFSLIAAACVNAFVLWMLKYPFDKKGGSARFFLLRIFQVVFAVPWIGYRPLAG